MADTCKRRGATNDQGFTLIELMIVVTIIGILAAVAIPRYISYVRTSQTAEVGEVGGQIVSAMQSYADSQSLTPTTAQALFNTATLAAPATTGAAPTCTSGGSGSTPNLACILPQLTLPTNAAFSYVVSAVAATGGPQNGDVAYCITATGTANAGISGGVVYYSSAPALTSTGGWSGRVYNKGYVSGLATAPSGVPAGGYCGTTAGTAQATQS